MMRATGFLLGTLLMLAVFLFVLGDGTAPSPAPLPVSRTDVTTPPSTGLAPVEAVSAEKAVDNGEPPVDVATAADAKNWLEVTSSGLKLNPQTWDASLAAYEAASRNDALPSDIRSRYRVWSPFHSKWAAEGFAQRLSQATAVPVEVVDAGKGSYQVVFSYRDDKEREMFVEQIETITGLELE